MLGDKRVRCTCCMRRAELTIGKDIKDVSYFTNLPMSFFKISVLAVFNRLKERKEPYLFYSVNVLNSIKLLGVDVFSDYWCVFGNIFLCGLKYVYKERIRLWTNTKETHVKVVDVSRMMSEGCEVGCRKASSWCKKGVFLVQEGHVLQRWRASSSIMKGVYW